MPGPVQDFLVGPNVPPVTFSSEPALNALHSLVLLAKAEKISGLGSWIAEVLSQMTPEEHWHHKLVILGFYHVMEPDGVWPSFPAYIEALAGSDPVALRDKMLDVYMKLSEESTPGTHTVETVLQSADAYVSFLKESFPPEYVDKELEAEAYTYVVDPPAMQALIVAHLRRMWEQHLEPEWARVQPILGDSIKAFQQINYAGMSKLEVAELVTGRESCDDCWPKLLEEAEQIVFVPSTHVGPYVGKFKIGTSLYVLFGARLPEGSEVQSPDLSRAEIVVRLGALADDTRLRMLRVISENGEQRSHDIMETLEISQSATSRHLKQLSATGLLSERRCNGAKCYSLNEERVGATLEAVGRFLLAK